jgi:hypothetical protein
MKLSSRQYKYARAVMLREGKVDLVALVRTMPAEEMRELAALGVNASEVPPEAAALLRTAMQEADAFLDYAKLQELAGATGDASFSPDVLAGVVDAVRANALFDPEASGLTPEGEQHFLLALDLLAAATRHLRLAHYAQARAIAEGQRR